jgi:hypothetical protein
LHRLVEEVQLLLESLAGLAPQEMKPDAKVQRKGYVPVLHLRERTARFLA